MDYRIECYSQSYFYFPYSQLDYRFFKEIRNHRRADDSNRSHYGVYWLNNPANRITAAVPKITAPLGSQSLYKCLGFRSDPLRAFAQNSHSNLLGFV